MISILLKPESRLNLRNVLRRHAPLFRQRIPFGQRGAHAVDDRLAIVLDAEFLAEVCEIVRCEPVSLSTQSHLMLARISGAPRVGQVVGGGKAPASGLVHEKADVFHVVVLIDRHDVEAYPREGLLQRRIAKAKLKHDAEELFI